MSLRFNVRAMDRRLAKLEKARRPRRSPFVVLYGSFDAFSYAAYIEVEAGKLDGEFLHILDALRRWEENGTWEMAHASA